MTILQATAFGYAELASTSPSAERDCTLLLQHAVGRYAHFCIAHPEYILTEQEEALFREHIAQRATGMPIAYITHQKEFYGKEFYVNEHVLIPRPETEGLIDLAIASVDTQTPLNVLDLCTGSGCVAITLASLLPHATITATDISADALMVAQLNARTHHAHISWHCGDLFDALPEHASPFHLIIANPPYVPNAHYEEIIPETVGLQFEPKIALVPNGSSETGMDSIERIMQNAERHLTATGVLAIEISDHHADNVLAAAHTYLPHKTHAVHTDLSGRTRYFLAQ